MEVTINLPEDVVRVFSANGANIERKVLEATALEEVIVKANFHKLSARQVKWAVAELNKRSRRIAELEAENSKLKAALAAK